MIREFNFIHFGQTYESDFRDNSEQLKKDANLLTTEFFYISSYIQRRLTNNNLMMKNLKKQIKKEKQIVLLNIGIGFDSEVLDYFPEDISLFYKTTFDYEQVKTVKDFKDRANLILDLTLSKAKNCEPYIPMFSDVLEVIIDDFKASNYKNTWEFAKKRINNVGMARLICELTPLRFYLRLIVEDKKNNIIFSKLLIETLPDPIFYHHKFKSLLVNNDEIIVTDRINQPFYRIKVADFLQQRANNDVLYFGKIPEWFNEFEVSLRKM